MATVAQTHQIVEGVVRSILIKMMKMNGHIGVGAFAQHTGCLVSKPRVDGILTLMVSDVVYPTDWITLSRMRGSSFDADAMSFTTFARRQTVSLAVLTRRWFNGKVTLATNALAHTNFSFASRALGKLLKTRFTSGASKIDRTGAMQTLTSLSPKNTFDRVDVNTMKSGRLQNVLSALVGVQNRLGINNLSTWHVILSFHMYVTIWTFQINFGQKGLTG